MGVNPVPDNILTPRSGSRTTLPRTPLPTPHPTAYPARPPPHVIPMLRADSHCLDALLLSAPHPSPVGATLVVAR